MNNSNNKLTEITFFLNGVLNFLNKQPLKMRSNQDYLILNELLENIMENKNLRLLLEGSLLLIRTR